MLIHYRIMDGKYIAMEQPVEDKEMTCSRCGLSKGRAYVEPAGRDQWCGKSSWFCLTPECLKIDSDASKEIARKKYFEELKKAIEQEKATRKELGIQDKPESTRSPVNRLPAKDNMKNISDIELRKLF